MFTQSNFPQWGSVQPANGERHLPIYLLLDTSSSMDGAPIESLCQVVEQFKQEVANDPFARDVVRVGIITFSSQAELVTSGLVAINDLQPPALKAWGVTRLDLAFKMLLDSMDRHLIKAVKGAQKGDWKPIVFVITDGEPTDERGHGSDGLWPAAREAVVNRPKGEIKPSSIVAVGCGSNVADATLKAISTGTAFRMGSNEAAFVALFEYLTQSIISSVGYQLKAGNVVDPFANIQSTPGLIHIP